MRAKEELCKLLMDYSTKEQPIFSKQLEISFKLEGVQVRDIIRQLRREGKPIANSKKGYFYAQSYEEYEETIQDLYNRSMSMLETIKAMRNAFNKSFQFKMELL